MSDLTVSMVACLEIASENRAGITKNSAALYGCYAQTLNALTSRGFLEKNSFPNRVAWMITEEGANALKEHMRAQW